MGKKMFKEKVYQKICNNIFLAYTIVFIVFMLIGLLLIEIKNQSIFFSGMFTSRDGQMDGFTQHSLFMYDFVRSFKGTIIAGDSFQLFRFNISMGSDIILHYTYYSLFDPLTIIAYIIPLQYLEYSYYLLIMLRLYLSGIFVILLAQRFNIKKVNALLATSIFYVFNAAVLFAAFRHPMFINGPMYIPLIILGAEKILNKERPYLLIITSFLALISQFYFYIYIALSHT